MNKTFKMQIVLLLAICISCVKEPVKERNFSLVYNQPAKSWMQQGLPLGNGYVGVMFLGGTSEERFQITDESLWRGGPGTGEDYNFGLRKDAWKNLETVRSLLKESKYEEAHQLANKKLTGIINEDEANPDMRYKDYGALQTMGDLFVYTYHDGKIENYERKLDVSNATAYVEYDMNGHHYSRKYFANYPSDVFVYQFKGDKLGGNNYILKFETPHIKVKETYINNVYSYQGKLSGNSMPFEIRLKVETTNGEVKFEDGKLQVTGSNEFIVYQTSSTGYKNEYPNYSGNYYIAENSDVIAKLKGKTVDQLYEEHLNDYHTLFNRFSLDLNGDLNKDTIPTDQRLKLYYKNGNDKGLETLFLQYNRYLMIAGSRPNSLPLTLQGKWNDSTNPIWASDYHMNINQQMLYWPAELTNLSECHMPLFDYCESLVEPGKISAKEFFNTRGWHVSTMNNAYGFTSSGWEFPWGFFPGGAAWICQHFWEHYLFTQDEVFLKERAYPIMKEAALFWIDYLVEDENGYLVSCPSYSPEHGGISTGASMDHQIAWDILDNCIQACKVLQTDVDFFKLATATRDRICPPMIGKWGQLQEWKEDLDDPKNQHRHVSHLFALHPGHQITVNGTPEFAEAAKTSLKARGDGGTGWSMAWKINFWARLKDGNHAYKMLKEAIDPFDIKDKSRFINCGGTYSNLLSTHPPFQLDGNMGSLAGMAEMLIQSHEGIIELLPALPDVWESGKVTGLKARGGYEIDFKWNNKKVTSCVVKSKKKGICKLLINNKEVEVDFSENDEQASVNL